MTSQRVVAVVPVRMGSSRLPGKVLISIAEKPMLGHLLDRLSLSCHLDGVVVATSEQPENDAIERFCVDRSTPCFRGDEEDVLGRILGALSSQNAHVGVLVFGDTPLIDPAIVDDMITRFVQADDYDFVGNDLLTTYPPGMEVEVFSLKALRDAAERTGDPSIREHGTLFIRQHPDIYRIQNVAACGTHQRPELEIEVDSPEDMSVISAIVDHFADRLDYSLDEIITFLDENPGLRASNQSVNRRWKQFRDDSH